jgi:cytochrome c556
MNRALLATALLVSGAVLASTPAQDVIDARQSGFKKMGAAMKAISEQLKASAPDLAKITVATQAISAGAREQPSWFPAGTGPESGAQTDALPHIWKDTSKFTALSGQLGTESGNLAAAAATGDLTAIRSQFKVLSEVCSTCHKSFRAD